MLPLLGVAVVVVGFLARINPLVVVMAAALVSGLAGGLDFTAIIAAFGKAFNENRFVSVTWLVLPVIGALERAGLQERARALITGIRAASVFSVICLYMLMRQVAVAIGLTSLGGQASMVRPLIAPMAQAAGEARLGSLPEAAHDEIRAQAAAAENIGLFFGEDIFVALGSILLIKGFLQQNGINVEPLQLSLWAIPTAIAAFIIHAARLFVFDRWLARSVRAYARETQR
jgi:uncharacterized membrane protein